MEQPDMSIVLNVETIVVFQVEEESLPLGSEAGGHIDPKAFNTDIMNGS